VTIPPKRLEIMDQILESMATFVVTDTEGRIVYVNRRYADILGVEPSEAIGKPVTDIIPGTRMHIVSRTGREEIASVFVQKNGETTVVNRLPIKKDGKTIGAIAFSVMSRTNELNTISTIEQISRLNMEIAHYKQELSRIRGAKYSLEQIIGGSKAIQDVKIMIKRVAQTKSTVLITGETGTGKELVAHAIHQEGPRRHGPFVKLNCAAIPADLLESELFGYEEGAFTGAKKSGKPGKFELAHGGTLLLDEIDQLPARLQSKLLRAIQEKEIDRVGGVKPLAVDFRLICISNQNISTLVETGAFREDLYYRINVVIIHTPPLRERLDDIPVLTEFLVKKINIEAGFNILHVDPKVLSLFQEYHWPGNVRELEHILERAANMAQSDQLEIGHFEFFFPRVVGQRNPVAPKRQGTPCLEEVRAAAEREAIIQALADANRNKKLASKILNIDRSVLYDKMKKYGIPL